MTAQACFYDCPGRFVSDLFENHIVGFPTRRLDFIKDGRHNENLPIQYTENFSAVKLKNFIGEDLMILIFMLETLIVGTC